jgi:hypothetical protein
MMPAVDIRGPAPDQGAKVFDVAHPDRRGSVVPFGSSGSLVVFEDARRAIAAAETIEQVNKILAMAIGLAAAARKATDRELEAEATALKFEAERRLGQLMAAQKETVGFSKGGRPKTGIPENPVSGKPPTLAEAGIDKNLADKARKAAGMPETEFAAAKEAKREAVLARTRLRTNTKSGGEDERRLRNAAARERRRQKQAPAKARNRFANTLFAIREACAHNEEMTIPALSVGERDESISVLKASIGALDELLTKVGGESLLHAQPDVDLNIENFDLRGEVEDLHGEIDALKARIAEQQAKPANSDADLCRRESGMLRSSTSALALLRSPPDRCTPPVLFDPQYRGMLDRLAYGNEGARQKERFPRSRFLMRGRA